MHASKLNNSNHNKIEKKNLTLLPRTNTILVPWLKFKLELYIYNKVGSSYILTISMIIYGAEWKENSW